MTTIARPTTTNTAHWYDSQTGEPKHFVPKADGKGLRPTTLRDARKHGWVPSPTSILKVLDKPALNDWKVEQGILTVLTAPRKDGEPDDAFVHRVIHEERQHEQEAATARDKGTEIHNALENALQGLAYDAVCQAYVAAVRGHLFDHGTVVATEKIVIGKGYGGKFDALLENETHFTVVDFKTCRSAPEKGPYPEHRMQVSAYAQALGNTGDKRIQCAIVYIPKEYPELTAIHVIEDWSTDWKKFELLLRYWYLDKNMEIPA